MRKTICRPQTSESGAKSKGPVAKPMRKVVTPSVATVLEHENVIATPPMAAVCILEQKVMVAVMNTMINVADHFFLAGQFVGMSPSSKTVMRSAAASVFSSTVLASATAATASGVSIEFLTAIIGDGEIVNQSILGWRWDCFRARQSKSILSPAYKHFQDQ